jgi:DNA-binding FrmR family transcriptional regulator
MSDSPHPDHSKLITRLSRIEGQIGGVKRMIEERRYCLDILAQTRAAQAALKAVEAEVLNTHLAHCVKDALQSRDEAQIEQKLAEIDKVFKSGK